MWRNVSFRHLRAPAGKALTLVNGTKVESLEDLSQAINDIDPDTFLAHVGSGKNDLADWVRDAFGLVKLEAFLRAYPTPLRMLVHIEAFLRGVLDDKEPG